MQQANFLCVPDLHIPFEHPDALAFACAVDRLWFPGSNRLVVFLGDEIDSHSISRHMPDPDGRSAKDEFELAKVRLRDWYREFPKAFVCTSNHTMRPWKRAYEAGLPKQFMRDVKEVLGAPIMWEWADRWHFNGIVFEHGENVSGPQGALNAAKQNQAPTAIGHLHTFGGVIHADNFQGKLWGLNTGCLIDTSAYAFAYAKTLRNKPTLGCGVIKNAAPYFVPMRLRADGRWDGAI